MSYLELFLGSGNSQGGGDTVNNYYYGVSPDDYGGGEQGFLDACDYAAANGVPVIGGSFTTTAQRTLPNNVEIHHATITISSGNNLVHSTGVKFYHCSFIGPGVVAASYATDNAEYLLCSFSNGAYINCSSGFNRGPQRLKVSGCVTTASPLIFGTTLNYSEITSNTVDATGRSFGISFAGRGNLVSNNTSANGVTGINVIPNRSTNQQQNLSDNRIINNYVHDTSEEGISLDCRGDSTTSGLAVASTTISSVGTDTVSFSDTFTANQNNQQFVVFQTGNRKAQYFRIKYSGSGGTGPYQLDGYTSDPSDVGQTVTVQLGAFNNEISGNRVENTGTAGILVYGSFIGSKLFNNDTFNSNIGVRSLCGIASTVSLSQQPAHYTHLSGNRVRNGTITVSALEYSGQTQIEPIGVDVEPNNRADSISITKAVTVGPRIGVSQRGDGDITLVSGIDDKYQRITTTLTADRALTLSSENANEGDIFNIVRTGGGAFVVNVNSGLKTIDQNEWGQFVFDGTSWQVLAFGVTQ